jgi:hypothetical protein
LETNKTEKHFLSRNRLTMYYNTISKQILRTSVHIHEVHAGITVLVILYGYVMLAPEAWIAVLIFLVVSCVFHVGFYVQVY